LTNLFGPTNLRDSYRTIVAEARAEIRIERSRFIGTILPVDNKALAESEYARICKDFHDATHNCYAYVIGMEPAVIFRYSDDGEPSGTAGPQIYEAITTRDITNTLLVVTRYFGGVKLGTGGLARAYRETANLVLDKAEAVDRFIMQRFSLKFAHEQVSAVMKILSDFSLKPEHTNYGDRVELTAAIREGLFDQFRARLIDRTHGKTEIEPLEVIL
jgi:uncharacterized YigZ family protein